MAVTDFRTQNAGVKQGENRLSAVLCASSAMVASQFAALPSNSRAIKLAEHFVKEIHQFAAVVGPSGWGKSELLQSISRSLTEATGISVPVTHALTWANSREKACAQQFLLLDDLQDVFRHPRAKHQLKLRLHQRARFKRPTFVTMVGQSHELITQGIFACPLSWRIESINEPTCPEREFIVKQIAESERIKLSPQLTHLLATHMNGNGRSIRGALLRLRLVKTDWSALSDLGTASGILMPYLIGENGWDLRDVVRDAVHSVYMPCAECGLTETEICAYILRNDIELREDEVAAFLRMTPGQVYRQIQRTATLMHQPACSQLVTDCQNAVLKALSDD